MAQEDISVVYSGDDRDLKAHVYLARDDAPRGKALLKPEVAEDVDWIQLKASDVEREKFTQLLDDNARATNRIWLWCYRPVWLKLLKLLDVDPPLPATVPWPPKAGKHRGSS